MAARPVLEAILATESPLANPVPKPRGWPLFLLGVVVFFAGPAVYAVQLAGLRQTVMPWAMLALTSAGVVLMALSLVRRFSVWRTLGCIVFLAFTAFQWVFFLVIARSPAYTGPAQAGAQIPSFATQLADGRSFSNTNLSAGEDTIFLFFRGFW
jgi:hypothetical protein